MDEDLKNLLELLTTPEDTDLFILGWVGIGMVAVGAIMVGKAIILPG